MVGVWGTGVVVGWRDGLAGWYGIVGWGGELGDVEAGCLARVGGSGGGFADWRGLAGGVEGGVWVGRCSDRVLLSRF